MPVVGHSKGAGVMVEDRSHMMPEGNRIEVQREFSKVV
jgi:hypothetical protein